MSAVAPATVTLRPPNPLTETVVEITVSAETVRLYLPEYVEEFRLAARRLCYEWTRPYWTRKINAFNGPLEDRVIEAAYRLLKRGFIIRVEASFQERIVAGEYQEEQTRWIFKRTSGQYEGWFAINWGRNEDYYREARKLRGSRYSKPAVVVPVDQFEEMLDFAEINGFRLSEAALALIEKGRHAKSLEIRVELRPREASAQPAREEAITGEIADEFRDDD